MIVLLGLTLAFTSQPVLQLVDMTSCVWQGHLSLQGWLCSWSLRGILKERWGITPLGDFSGDPAILLLPGFASSLP